MIDIARDPRWGRIVEGAGEDPYLGARMAVAQVAGYQGGNTLRPGALMATAKHFGAYGAAIGGRDYNTADLSERTLQEVYLPPFYAAARAGSGSFMVAFNDIAGVPTTANRELLRGLLRERWGWQGLMVSDWGSVGELINHGVAADRAAAASLALDASVDMDMVGGVFADDLKVGDREGSGAPQTTRRSRAAHPARQGTARAVRQAHAVPRCRARGARAARAGSPGSGARHRTPVHRAAQERGQTTAARSRASCAASP